MNKITLTQEGRYLQTSLNDRLDLTKLWKLRHCTVSDGAIAFKEVVPADPQEQGFHQEFTYLNGKTYIDGIPVDLSGISFSLINRGDRWYINKLTRDGLLKVLVAAQVAHEDTGFVETNHASLIAWVQQCSVDMLDAQIMSKWRQHGFN